ncbi:polysaccharide biosynthesis/export family protein [uncultured Aliiroseovarius sp.]|uniref:polysaccharide biosynthesis/export family protein n=1 Tax=uncultured Aliiroseovarius sp. TaxID=1658783 RepID=UPI0026124728|nr:polysaccharide biosynthesis/export family protein [uncultured Aliiroseovarius sp.]
MGIGIGDTVSLTIWEAGPGGLFATSTTTADGGTTTGGRTMIPGQVVGQDGKITVPFAGRIRANGYTPAQLEDQVVQQLTGRAINPQVVVSVSNRVSGSINIIGNNVALPRLPLSPAGDRILDVIARAGAATSSVENTEVRLTRGSRSSAIPFTRLLQDPSENIYVQAGDNVFLTENPNELTILGAAGRNTAVKFGAEVFSLGQAIANAGGLLDRQADPAGIFVFRMEPHDGRRASHQRGGRPTIYHVDLTTGMSIFQANRFQMRDGDVIYVATARTNALEKFIAVLSAARSEVSAIGAL